MKKFSHDIQCTLLIKAVLLIILWLVCFRGAEKNTTQASQWLFGVTPMLKSGESCMH